ncbi:hypothetical protein SDRG_10292 [Saprolegnia diclina VS20]|uniref:Uncharacterized protein n=1 Tax=Saprolegnia diclina (strain VS20) TaxID=1156394 RepID=T0QBM6_SAPDV|nr:hypothetical protein SDRG_10292 [Saprolegnia diclina VS20]EQC32096.1 hypothetical protein SDRG_10292 [Saprolegnia diclina VS20]|eukprot:XP_008614498.1 hypothetical protein SDRG_10292 [Saprolegnia diclina VS20]
MLQRLSKSPPRSPKQHDEIALDLPTIHPRLTKDTFRATHTMSSSSGVYVGGSLAAVLLTCALLDATSFFLHLCVYLALTASACVGHRYVSARVYGGRPAVAVACVVLALLWPWPGLLCMALATLAILGVCDVILLALVPGTMLVVLSWLVLLVVASTMSLWMACVLGAAAVSVGHQRQLLALAPVVHGTLLAIASAICLALFGVLVVLSMNPFWLATNEVSKYDALRYLGRDASLDATRIASLDDLATWHAATPRSFPFVIKPNVCTTSSAGVRLCRDYACLEAYVRERQATGSRQDDNSWVLQKAAYGLEAVVFFYRYPYATNGDIKSIGLRDASRTEGVDGNDLRANYFTSDGNRLRTDAFVAYFRNLTARFDGPRHRRRRRQHLSAWRH